MIDWDKYVDDNHMIVKICLFDGREILTACNQIGQMDDRGSLTIVKRYRRNGEASENASNDYMYTERVFAPGVWIEYEDVSDRIVRKEFDDLDQDRAIPKGTG